MTSQCTQSERVWLAANAAVALGQPRTAGGRSSAHACNCHIALPLFGRHFRRRRNLTKLTASVRSRDHVEATRFESGMAQ